MLHDGDDTARQSSSRATPSDDRSADADSASGSDPGDDPPSPRAREATQDTPLEIHADSGVGPAGRPDAVAALVNRLRAAIGVLAVPVDRLVVRLVSDPAMIELHTRHCGLGSTTDVLTFCSSAAGEPIDADIACCVDEAVRQAARRGHSVADELLLYALHGVLHCVGHDDHDPEAYERMHAEEDRILSAIGVGVRFAVPADEAPSIPVESPGART